MAVDHIGRSSLTVLPWFEIVLFVPAGLLRALALWEGDLERSLSVGRTTQVGLAIAVLGEAAHTALARPFELGPILVHGAGFTARGWLISKRVLMR